MTVTIVPVWLSSAACSIFIILALLVIYILIRDEIRAMLDDRAKRKEERNMQDLFERHKNDPVMVLPEDKPFIVTNMYTGDSVNQPSRVFDQEADRG